MNQPIRLVMGFAVFVASTGVSLAQHEGHQMSAAPTGGGACAEHSRASLEIIDRAQRRLEESRQTNSPARMRASMDDLQRALAELRTHQSLCVSAAATEAKSSEAAKPGSSPGMEMMDHSKTGHSASPPASPTPHDMGTMDHSKMSMPGMSSSPKSPPTSGAKRSSETKMDHLRMNMPGMSKESQSKSASSSKTDLEQPPTPAKTKDPVCGKEVATQAAEKATYQGKTYYFCSRADREKFLSDPAPYVNR